MESTTNKEQKPKRQRQSNGRFKTKSTEIENGLDKKVDYTIKKKISSPKPEDKSAGKYVKQEKIQPGFGSVKTTLH